LIKSFITVPSAEDDTVPSCDPVLDEKQKYRDRFTQRYIVNVTGIGGETGEEDELEDPKLEEESDVDGAVEDED
jgi:hypothetical protein